MKKIQISLNLDLIKNKMAFFDDIGEFCKAKNLDVNALLDVLTCSLDTPISSFAKFAMP